MAKEWRAVKGYEGLYEVSSAGDVRSLDKMYWRGRYGMQSKRGRIMNHHDNGTGYRYISLVKDGVRKNHYVHRLVAEAFIPAVDGKEYVNHIDRNRANNNVDNLEWCTCSENVRHSVPYRRKFNRCRHGEYGLGIRLKGKKYEVGYDHKYLGRYERLEDAIKAREEYIKCQSQS
jgi:hypothetical protein